jgi:hypothetical protein
MADVAICHEHLLIIPLNPEESIYTNPLEVTMAFDVTWLFLSFGGGILGAAFGGLPIFVLCGVAAIVGAAVNLATGDGSFTNLVAFGPILGPQISFAGGAAAAAYAAKKGKLATGGRDITAGLMGLDSPDVLLVGGAFGMVGYLLWWALAQLPSIGTTGFTNPIALSIVINAIIVRLMFGKTGIFGKVPNGNNRWLGGAKPLQIMVLALGAGVAVTWTTLQVPALASLWFGISVTGLVFLQYGTKVPVWHQIALAAEQAVVVGGGDLGWGLAFAILGGFLGEIYAMLFNTYGDTHIDPPSATLATTFFTMAILKAMGAFAITGVGSLIVAAVVAVAGFALLSALRARSGASVPTAAADAA